MSQDWYQQSINALQLNSKGERTQKAYTVSPASRTRPPIANAFTGLWRGMVRIG